VKLAAEPRRTPAGDSCFNCRRVGHYAADCPRSKQPCNHIRAVRTEVPGDDAQERSEEVVQNDKSSHHLNKDMDFQESRHGNNNKHVKVDVYDNNYYTRKSDYDMMALMTDIPASKDDSEYQDIKMHKVLLWVSKESHLRPTVPQGIKECLVMLIDVSSHQAWTLWDSGSMTTGITPSFVNVAKIKVFLLSNPHILQLGTVRSRATVNFGTYVHIFMHGMSHEEYVDMANFDHYDMIIGMLFMRARKVVLDFE